MARYKDPIVTDVLGKQLMPGEQLQHWAYGVKQPHIGLIILLMCMAILPGAIAVAIMTKEYVIGLTSHRLLVLQVKGGKATIIGKQEYNRAALPPAKTSTGGLVHAHHHSGSAASVRREVPSHGHAEQSPARDGDRGRDLAGQPQLPPPA